MDFLDELLAGFGPVEKEITFNGKTGTMYFQRITGAQKLQLVKGRKYAYNTAPGAAQTFEVDLEENERTQHQMILFSVCEPTGKPKFKNLADVQKLDAQLIDALYKAAQEVNKAADNTDDAPGEA